MNNWLNEIIFLINKSINDISLIPYQNFVYIFYDHLSNRNLAILISKLYGLDESEIYFEIDKIISKKLYDIEIVKNIESKLNNNGFQEWIDADE